VQSQMNDQCGYILIQLFIIINYHVTKCYNLDIII